MKQMAEVTPGRGWRKEMVQIETRRTVDRDVIKSNGQGQACVQFC
jgi:hypothetical protein